jgi:hypothetical protein
MPYNSDRKGFETKDGGLIRVNGSGDKVRIDIYDGDERSPGKHTRDSVNYDTNTGTGRIDSHNEDKSERSSTDTTCYLTSACIQHHLSKFNDNCYELQILRWFRDNFVSQEDIEHYYKTAPMVVTEINKQPNSNDIYNGIYHNVIVVCVRAIEQKKYDLAYNVYKESILNLEEQFGRQALQKRLVMALGGKRNLGFSN